MTLASDQNLGSTGLSETARRMLELRDVVFTEWETRLRATVEEASALPHPILINTFPTLYDNIAEAVSPNHPRKAATDTNTVASEHGSERARITNYSHQAVIAEYQLLRWTILDVLNQNRVKLNKYEFAAINSSIDRAIQESVNSFTLAQAALRERFIVALTHDLRNPLQVVSSAAQLVLHTDNLEKAKQLATKIVQHSDRMDRMIQELLDTAVFQSGERLRLHVSNFDIQDVVKEVVGEFTEAHGAHVEVLGGPVNGWWDRDALKRVIENLVGNALKYGEPESGIRIKIDEQHERMLLSVHNKGEPIPPEQLESVFQVFRRAETTKGGDHQGWGVGLPYVRSAAESHGGSVQIDSSVERGTTVSIDLPIDSRPYQNAPTLSGG
jgi:signal transduction histidine kinase